MRKQFAKTVFEVAKEDPRLSVMVGDISHGILKDLWSALPRRYFNIGVCEPAMMSFAAGLSMSGLIPVVHTIAPFLIERSYEQIKLDFCYQGLGGNIVSVGSAFDYSKLGCSHHCYNDYGILKLLPTMEIVYPASEKEFDALFRQTYSNGRPTYFRLPEKKHTLNFKDEEIVFGKVIKAREGSDITIIAIGPQLENALFAAEEVSKRGIDAEVLYPHTIKPLDQETIVQSMIKTKRVLIVEEHSLSGGLGMDVLALASTIPFRIKCERLGIPDVFLRHYGKYEEHCAFLGLTKNGIVDKLLKLVQTSNLSS